MSRVGDSLLVRVKGFHTPGPVAGVIGDIQAELERQKLTRLLLDLRALTGLVTASDHIADAQLMVEKLRGVRWATVVRREQYSGAGQAYCIEQGCDMDTFFDEALAIEWLESDRGAAGPQAAAGSK